MEIRQSVRNLPTRPLAFAIAMLFALALALLVWFGVSGSSRPPAAPQTRAATLSPDAQERNAQILAERGQRQSAPETTHGH